MKSLTLYYPSAFRFGWDRVATFELTAEGPVKITVVDERYRSVLHSMPDGVGVRSLRRVVRPEEGQVYLDGLVEHLQNASHYRLVEESEGDQDSGAVWDLSNPDHPVRTEVPIDQTSSSRTRR